MSDDAAFRSDLMLERAAQLAFARVEHFHEQAMAAEDIEEAAAASRAADHAGRGLRQCIALLDRLKRLRAQDAREAERTRKLREELEARIPAPWPKADDMPRIRRRADDLRTAVQRVIWNEYEHDDWDDEDDEVGELCTRLEYIIQDGCQDARFGLQPLDDHVEAVCAGFRLDPEAAVRWRDLPDPPRERVVISENDDGSIRVGPAAPADTS